MGNCVGFYNYKFFVNFLLWVSLLCALVLVEAVPYALVLFGSVGGKTAGGAQGQSIHILFLGIGLLPCPLPHQQQMCQQHHNSTSTVAAAMLFSAGFLLESHISFTLVNTTTLESHGGVCPPYPPLSPP